MSKARRLERKGNKEDEIRGKRGVIDDYQITHEFPLSNGWYEVAMKTQWYWDKKKRESDFRPIVIHAVYKKDRDDPGDIVTDSNLIKKFIANVNGWYHN